ncbi:T-complex-associated testis-expressed protein 1 [Oopsacas minuta]|uniref:T-complex-associated testis-expressed protein 1 n=1 Tax=Oopsacas minuta TaxID=111878 RepID=A0AAV7KC37_9METZ|nr:T-complex-associated testis-expressed protein 1 [Oopsacas minuta]
MSFNPTSSNLGQSSSIQYSHLLDETISSSANYIEDLLINHLQYDEPYQNKSIDHYTEANEDVLSDLPIFEHFNPRYILKNLHRLHTFVISYSTKNVGMNFDWSYFNFSTSDAINLSEGLKLSLNLYHLGVISSLLNCSHFKIIHGALMNHLSIRSIDFSHNKISDHGFKYFGKILSSMNCHLTHIDLSNNLIGMEGAASFSHGLEQNITLKCLNLKLNRLGDEGSEHIFKALIKNHILESLNLSSNNLTDFSCRCLAEMLVLNNGLKFIDLCCNSFHESGGKYIQDRIEENYSLLDLNLTLTDISQESETYIAQILERNKQRQILHI